VTLASCGQDKVKVCAFNFLNDLLRQTLNVASPYKQVLCSSWNATLSCMQEAVKPFPSDGVCYYVHRAIDSIVENVQSQMNWICTPVECSLRSASVCIARLEYTVRLNQYNSTHISQLGLTDDQIRSRYNDFCQYSKKTLACIKRSSLTCSGSHWEVSAAYTRFFLIQSETGIQCISPCASNPCQNGGVCSPVSPTEGYQCQCPIGYTGTNCETEVCVQSEIRSCTGDIMKSFSF